MKRYILTVDDIHCSSCVEKIRSVIAEAMPSSLGSQISIEDKTATVFLPDDASLDRGSLSKKLVEGGFKLLSIDDIDVTEGWFENLLTNWKKTKSHKRICKECQKKQKHKKKQHQHMSLRSVITGSTSSLEKQVSTSDLSNVTTLTPEDEKQVEEYRAQYSIGGMSCASCSNSITSVVTSEFPQLLDFAIDLMNASAVAVINDKRLASQIQEVIKETGFTCELVELLPVQSSRCWKVVASIGGMTCSSCVNAITQQVESLPFVESVKIDLLSNSATTIVNNINKISALEEAIEDCGFDYDQVEIKEVRHATIAKRSRTVNLQVVGMFCE